MQQQSSIKYTIATIVWTLIVLTILFMPSNQISVNRELSIPGIDKVAHFILFAVLAFLVVKAIKEQNRDISLLTVFVFLTLFGLSTEFIQNFLPHRHGDLMDLFADLLGVATVLLFFRSQKR